MSHCKPKWLSQTIRSTEDGKAVRGLLSSLGLNTVCLEANCPNRNSCYGDGTATFLIMGKNCTRNCRFCNIAEATPEPIDPTEPRRVAEAVQGMNLSHAVITSVTRDDVGDGGAGHFAETIEWTRKLNPVATIEVLIPDFNGREQSLDTVLDAKPDVLNHNIETVEALYSAVRPQAEYARSLDILRRSASRGFIAKSGMMLGLGETIDQLETTLKDLATAGIKILTIGQYIAPSKNHHPVIRYIPPDEFDSLADLARSLGIDVVVSGPLVRSSFKAGEAFVKATKSNTKEQGGD
ncbi:MAG TPA: lipoyl synthase [candidate division Zixibacteria bacterium]|nr:lipoyl synthase [candidate division Zixibacteria bacterium]